MWNTGIFVWEMEKWYKTSSPWPSQDYSDKQLKKSRKVSTYYLYLIIMQIGPELLRLNYKHKDDPYFNLQKDYYLSLLQAKQNLVTS